MSSYWSLLSVLKYKVSPQCNNITDIQPPKLSKMQLIYCWLLASIYSLENTDFCCCCFYSAMPLESLELFTLGILNGCQKKKKFRGPVYLLFTLGKPGATLNHLKSVLASHPFYGEIELIPSELITKTATSINLWQKCWDTICTLHHILK